MKETPYKFMNQVVDVTRKEGDGFANDFTGFAIGVRNGNVQVRDAEDDVWEVDFDQVKLST
jgi:hypothetical protein